MQVYWAIRLLMVLHYVIPIKFVGITTCHDKIVDYCFMLGFLLFDGNSPEQE